MRNVTIRRANASDIPGIQRLYRQLDKHHADLLPDVFQPLDGDARADEVLRKWIERDDADCLLAEVDGRVVGFLNAQKSNHPSFPMFRPHAFAMIENAVVDKKHRGRGIGRTLFDAAMAWAKEHGLRYVQTTVWYDNAAAREFYVAQGFRPMTVRLEMDTERNVEPAATSRLSSGQSDGTG